MATTRHPARPNAQYVLVYRGPMSLLNRDRNRHWSTRSERDTLTKTEAHALALAAKVPKANRIAVASQPIHKGGTLPDPGAEVETTKAFIDGLVIAHVIPDDTADHLDSITHYGPRYSDQTGIIYTITIDPD